MRHWKKRALQLLHRMRELDIEGAGLTLPELYRTGGEARSILRADLAWLVEVGAVTRKLDATKRPTWQAVPQDDQEPRTTSSVVGVPDLGLDGTAEEVLSSLGA